MSYDFVEPATSTLKVQVYVDADGNISATNITGKKYKQVEGFAVDGTVADACLVLDLLFGEGTYNPKSIKKITVCKVADTAIVEIEFNDSDIAQIFSGSYNLQGTKFNDSDIAQIFTGTYELSGRDKIAESDIAKIFTEE